MTDSRSKGLLRPVEIIRYGFGPTRWSEVLWPFDLTKYRLRVNLGRWHFLWIQLRPYTDVKGK